MKTTKVNNICKEQDILQALNFKCMVCGLTLQPLVIVVMIDAIQAF